MRRLIERLLSTARPAGLRVRASALSLADLRDLGIDRCPQDFGVSREDR